MKSYILNLRSNFSLLLLQGNIAKWIFSNKENFVQEFSLFLFNDIIINLFMKKVTERFTGVRWVLFDLI